MSELDANPIFALLPGQGSRIAEARIRINLPDPRFRETSLPPFPSLLWLT
jgi:hypothetical protein